MNFNQHKQLKLVLNQIFLSVNWPGVLSLMFQRSRAIQVADQNVTKLAFSTFFGNKMSCHVKIK